MRWIIGDIHGMLAPLEALLEKVSQQDSRPQWLFAGDYVNRGPSSRKVIDLLLTLDNARFIRGNHDDLLDLVLHGQAWAPNAAGGNRVAGMAWFLEFGLDTTLCSYGADWGDVIYFMERPSEKRLSQLITVIPEAHRQFIHNLPGVIEEPDIFVAHGKWDVDELAENPDIASAIDGNGHLRELLLWGRYESAEIARVKAWRRTGFFGHTPTETYPLLGRRSRYTPIIGRNIVLLDTGAALSASGRLTAWCVEESRFVQVDHFGEDVE